jgi:hypothetical protein
MAQVSAEGVTPFKMDNDFVIEALKGYGFTPANSVYTVRQDNKRNYVVTQKAAYGHDRNKTEKVKKLRSIRN